MENLAPAGNAECLERAVAAGADAVYLGCSAFSARAGAGNFNEAQLRQAVDFAHLHHVRVHVTVNTLIKDAEMPRLLDLLRLLNDVRADAVLVQDLGVLSLARDCFPGLPIHASTQMAIHNATGAAWCARMGMTRAVLARECSLREITLAAGQPIEIEVFAHGAQCVGTSGQCLFSSMIGTRSGNRGRCAQPCRLPYTYRGKRGAWLSPRDVCLRDELPRLEKAGVASVKIEGRLKRPEYVAVVAGSYRRGLDGAPATGEEHQALLQIFQRGGFMPGYAMGAEDAAIIDPARVNHGGVPIGQIASVSGGLARLQLLLPLADGDGLQIRHGQEDHEMIYAGKDVAAGETAVLRLRPDMRAAAGDAVVRLTSSSQLEQARSLTIPPIPCHMRLSAFPGQPLTLTVTDGETTAVARGDAVQPAKSRPLTSGDARRSLEKTGDTPFALDTLTVETENAFVPVSALNALRREALDLLARQRSAAFARPAGRELPEAPVALPRASLPQMTVCRTMAQLSAVKDGLACWYPEDFRQDALKAGLAALPEGAWLHLPMACEEATLHMLHRLVSAHAARLGGVVLGSVGQLGLSWPVPMGAGSGIPVMNRRAAALLLEQGCTFVTASPELSGQELSTLMAGQPPILVPAYGYAQLMLLHHCPARTFLGLAKGHAACRMCDENDTRSLQGTALIDRKGVAFPLLRQRLPEGCLVRLMNAFPTDNLSRVKAAGYAPLIELTLENGEGATSGHWNRPVE